jgi:hypothetical protein
MHTATCNVHDHKIVEIFTQWLERMEDFCGRQRWITDDESWILVKFPENKKGIKDTRVFSIKERDEMKQC